MNLDFGKLNMITLILLFTMIAGSIFPGGFFIYIFNKELFFQMEFIKLIFLISSITIPIFLFNFLLASHIQSIAKKITHAFIISNFMTTLLLFVPILIRFIISKISFRQAVIVYLILQTTWLLIVILSKIENWIKKRKKK